MLCESILPSAVLRLPGELEAVDRFLEDGGHGYLPCSVSMRCQLG